MTNDLFATNLSHSQPRKVSKAKVSIRRIELKRAEWLPFARQKRIATAQDVRQIRFHLVVSFSIAPACQRF